MPTAFANTNALHAEVVARTLTRLGVRAAVISPGSRSTPLTHALVHEPGLDCTPVLDERTAGFFALGQAKASGEPVVLLCTSGTAAANYLPAVIEARLSSTPLLVLTADRPPEMRDCASGQTIDQLKIFGHYPVWQAELAVPAPDAATTLAHWRQSFVHAVERAREARGPVHLNLPFRDPLAPHEEQPGFRAPAGFDLHAFCAHEPLARPADFEDSAGLHAALNFCGRFEKVLIVAGAVDSTAADRRMHGLRRLGAGRRLPLLADSLSSLRHHASPDELVTAYDLILRDDAVAAKLRPDAVVRLGQPPTSKVLRRRLAEWDVPTLVLSPAGDNLDPLHRRAHTLRTDPARWESGHLRFALEQPAHAPYADAWLARQRRLVPALDAALDAETGLREPHVTRLVARHAPPGTPLFVANSMPVRDTEMFLGHDAHVYPVFHNRGANGIDGTLGSALGVAHALARPVVLLTGDLSLLHDSNALLLAPHLRGSLTVVLVNNAGGGIFNHLPIAQNPAFEKFWATPQRIDFAKLAAAHRVEHTLVPDAARLAAALATEPAPGTLRLLEIHTHRDTDAAFRKTLYARLGESA